MTRFTRTVTVLGIAALAAAAIGPVASRADTAPFSPGLANAQAQGFRINPTAAQLSVGFTFGLALAGYQNKVAKADARGIDLGIIGTTLAAAGCDGGKPTLPQDQQPNPLVVDSRDQGADAGKTQPETVNKTPLPGINKYVRATGDPFGEARADYANVDSAGLFDVRGVRTDSVVHVLDGKTREAVATTDIGFVDIGAGAVKLNNLHWQVIHHTGGDTNNTAVFTLGSATIGGRPIPTQDPSAAFAAANQALKQLGIELRSPKVRNDNGILYVDPLAVAVIPNSTRDQISGTILGGVQPIREQVTNAMLQASCKFGSFLTVLDIGIGSLTGSGSFALELGGVQSTTGDLNLSHVLDFGSGGLGGSTIESAAPSVAGASTTAGVGGAAVGTPGGLTTGGSITPSVGTTTRKGRAAVGGVTGTRPRLAAKQSSRGGALTLVALAGLLLLAAAVEGDRRTMRRAQRFIPEG